MPLQIRFHRNCAQAIRLWMSVAILLALLAASARAAEGLLDPDEAIKAAAEITREKYPNADHVLAADYVQIRYREDGTADRTDDTYQKILTEKGRRANAEMTFNFTLPYETTPTLAVLRIVKPDGAIVPIDIEAQSKVMVDASQQASNIYDPNSKVLSVGIPGLEVGDVVHYVSKTATVKARVPNTWSDYQLFEYTAPIVRSTYEAIGPKALPLSAIAIKDSIEGTVTYTTAEEGDTIRYRWDVRNVDQMFPEPSMPALYNVVQRLLVSTIPNWEFVSKWYWNLSEPHFAVSPEMRETLAEIVKGIEGDRKRLEAIFYWVSQNIRYVGITVEKEAPGYEPHDAKMTFDNRHGVCRDKAALLVAMLREAGFKAFPVIIHNGPKKDVEVANTYFNHAITAVEEADGSYTLMDPTDENTKELFPSYLCDQSYLVAKPEGETLLVSPIIPAAENLMRIATRAKINAAGDLTGECTLDFDGINDNAYRGFFSRSKPEDRRRYFEGVVKSRFAGARLTQFGVEPENMLDTSKPLAVRLAFEAEDVPVEGDNTVMLPVPHFGAGVGMVNFVLDRTGLNKRKYPLKTDFACGVRESLTLELDAALGEIVAMPEYPVIDDPTLTWKQTLSQKEPTGGDAARILTGESEFLLKVVEFSPEQYLALKETRKKIEYNARKMPILTQPKSDETAQRDDVRILEGRSEYDIADARNWKHTRYAKKEILTYNGKKDNSEIQISYNPAWEDVRLVRATVANGNEIKEISPEEINLMDAEWAASAPRYPGGKTLVANLPGVEIGSIIEYEIEYAYRDHPFFSTMEVFRGSDALVSKTVTLRAPESLALQVFESNALVGSGASDALVAGRAVRDGKVERTWTAVNQAAIKPEDGLPPVWSFNPTVLVSSGDWKTYARSVELVVMQAAENQPSAAARARQIVEGIEGERARIVAIRDFIAKSIRSTGPSLPEMPLSAVTSADATLSDGYGNATDQAILLYAMLRAAGFEPEFVLSSYAPLVERLRKTLLDYADPQTFDGVLVRVQVDGTWIYLNDTDQYAALGATPHDGHACLALATGAIETVRATADRRDLDVTLYDVALEANGDARIEITRLLRGNAFASSHRAFSEMPPEERDRYHQEAVAAVSQAAVADGDLVARFDETYPGVVEFAVKVERYAVRDGKFLYFQLPSSLGNLLGLRADTRENPVYWASERRSTLRTVVTLPTGFEKPVLTPGALKWTAPGASGSVTVEEEVGLMPPIKAADAFAPGPVVNMTVDFGSFVPVYAITHTVALDPAVIGAEDYADLLELNRRLSHVEARTVLLREGEAE